MEDIEYHRHGDQPLLARVFKPRGEGPFPALVECHGGAWCMSTRTTEHLRHEFMASHGIVSIALDFRSGDTDPYPASVQDINFAVRWAKLRARDLKTRPELIGISGQSSGGHLAMLVAMRPHDARYSAIALPAGSPAHDASVRCAVLSWPVINPLSRYRHAKRAQASANPPEWPKSIIARQDSYWRSEANMAEGTPMLALERGEKVLMPPAIWFQGRGDMLHDYKDAESDFPGNEPQRFVADYQKAGGAIELHYIEMDRHAGHSPDLSKAGDMFAHMVEWVGRHIAAA
jgi:acetyl esterase/lipase